MNQNCTCSNCQKQFKKGDEGDNETLCLRCERELTILDMSEEDYENFDIYDSDFE